MGAVEGVLWRDVWGALGKGPRSWPAGWLVPPKLISCGIFLPRELKDCRCLWGHGKKGLRVAGMFLEAMVVYPLEKSV